MVDFYDKCAVLVVIIIYLFGFFYQVLEKLHS